MLSPDEKGGWGGYGGQYGYGGHVVGAPGRRVQLGIPPHANNYVANHSSFPDAFVCGGVWASLKLEGGPSQPTGFQSPHVEILVVLRPFEERLDGHKFSALELKCDESR